MNLLSVLTFGLFCFLVGFRWGYGKGAREALQWVSDKIDDIHIRHVSRGKNA